MRSSMGPPPGLSPSGGGGPSPPPRRGPLSRALSLPLARPPPPPAIRLAPLGLADDDLVAVVSNMGAPLVGQERLTDPRPVARAVEMMEEYIGRRFRAIMAVEIGGGNALQPFMAAALLA